MTRRKKHYSLRSTRRIKLPLSGYKGSDDLGMFDVVSLSSYLEVSQIERSQNTSEDLIIGQPYYSNYLT